MNEVKKKKWCIEPECNDAEKTMQQCMNTNAILSKLLVNRGITTEEAARSFLYDGISELEDPFSLKDMDKAIHRIEEALEKREKIVIYGDYDVDGITATSLLYRFFRKLEANVSYYIPERQSEGYGLNEEALEHLIQEGTDLIITVDCGISSADLVEAVKDRVSMIITDHHNAPEIIPPAYAVVNPKQADCPYADKNLSGVGVAFKLCQALWQKKYGKTYNEDLDIVALGTVADVVPLVGENRILVREGLKKINNCPQLGIDRLCIVAGLEGKEITTGHVGFTLAPRLNAAGRVAHATEGVRLLVTDDFDEAEEIALFLQETNAQRQAIERDILEQAIANVEEQGDKADKVLVVAGEEWHQGVIGIVASRLVEKYYKPTLVLSIHDGIGKGSCRSIDGFDMYEALSYAKDLLIQFGGHKQAAGFSIEEEKIPLLRERLTQYCQEHLTAEDYIPVVHIDAAVEGKQITLPHVKELSLLEPYGMGNPTPVFCVKEAKVTNVRLMGAEKNHVKFTLDCGGTQLDAISWFGRDYAQEIENDTVVKAAFTLSINEWQGQEMPQLMLQDIQPLYEKKITLTEEKLRNGYLMIKRLFRQEKERKADIETDILRRDFPDFSTMEMLLAVEVFKELGIIETIKEDDVEYYGWRQIRDKLDLCTSLTFIKYS